MVHKKLLLHILAKLDWIVILIASMTGFVMASPPDTVYITTSGSTLTITQSGTILTQGTTTAYATTTAQTLFSPAKVAILNNSTVVRSWNFPDYIFKINGSVVSTTATFVSGVTALNPGNIKSMKLLKEIIVVVDSASIGTDANITYLVGAQDTINISGLNGNTDKSYRLECTVINPTTSDTHILRFNGVATNVYDYKFSYAGSTSQTAGSAATFMAICPSVGTNSITHFNLNIDATTGINRTFLGSFTAINANQITVNNSGITAGLWRDNSTNITSMTFRYASISGGYGVGTRIKIYSLQP